jgi:hypothetical protein
MRRVAPQRTVFLRKLITVRMWRPVYSKKYGSSPYMIPTIPMGLCVTPITLLHSTTVAAVQTQIYTHAHDDTHADLRLYPDIN